MAGLRRFTKGFLAGGLAQVALILGPGIQFTNLEDLKAIGATLFFGFLVGGILAIEKMVMWQEPTPTIDSLPQ